MSEPPPEIQVLSLDSSPTIPRMVRTGGNARAVVWPGIGAQARSLHLIELAAKGETEPLRHDSEAVYYVLKGEAVAVDVDADVSYSVYEGGMIFVEPDTTYVLSCQAGPTEIVGGPCPADPRLYEGMDPP